MTDTNGHLIQNILALPFFLTEAIFLLYVADCPTYFENDLMTLVHHKHDFCVDLHLSLNKTMHVQGSIMGCCYKYIK